MYVDIAAEADETFLKPETHLLANFSCLQFGPRMRTEGLTCSSRQKEEVTFYCRLVWVIICMSVLNACFAKS